MKLHAAGRRRPKFDTLSVVTSRHGPQSWCCRFMGNFSWEGREGMMGFHILLLKQRGGNDHITNLNVIDNLSFVNYPPFNGF